MESENPPRYGITLKGKKSKKDDLQGESDGLQPTDTMMDDSEARNDF